MSTPVGHSEAANSCSRTRGMQMPSNCLTKTLVASRMTVCCTNEVMTTNRSTIPTGRGPEMTHYTTDHHSAALSSAAAVAAAVP